MSLQFNTTAAPPANAGSAETQQGFEIFGPTSTSNTSTIYTVDTIPLFVRAYNLASGDVITIEMVNGLGPGQVTEPFAPIFGPVQLTPNTTEYKLTHPGRYKFVHTGPSQPSAILVTGFMTVSSDEGFSDLASALTKVIGTNQITGTAPIIVTGTGPFVISVAEAVCNDMYAGTSNSVVVTPDSLSCIVGSNQSPANTYLGANAIASGGNALALGTGATANGSFAITVGALSNAHATRAIAIGGADTAGVNSVGIGSNVAVAGANAVGLGSNITTVTTNGVAIGNAAGAVAAGVVAVGISAGASASIADSVFIGTSAGAAAIGASPDIFIGLNAGAGETFSNLVIVGSDAAGLNATQANQIILGNSTQTQLVTAGSIIQGGVISASDERLKKDIADYEDGLNVIEQLNPVSFNWDEDALRKARLPYLQSDMDKTQYGLIAQDLEKVLPEVIEKTDTGFMMVHYERLIPHLISAIKTLNEQVQTLTAELDELRG